MKNENIISIKTCPRCGKIYHGIPAISRTDNKTAICPDCYPRNIVILDKFHYKQ